MTDNELDQRLIASLTPLTVHLDEQNERIETLTAQLADLPSWIEQVEHLRAQVNSLTTRLTG